MECYLSYLATKQNKILVHATTWVTFGSAMLSERDPSKKTPFLFDTIYTKCPEGASLRDKK